MPLGDGYAGAGDGGGGYGLDIVRFEARNVYVDGLRVRGETADELGVGDADMDISRVRGGATQAPVLGWTPAPSLTCSFAPMSSHHT